jgi:RNA polymerase sigma-70 factor, ECF subfamily
MALSWILGTIRRGWAGLVASWLTPQIDPFVAGSPRRISKHCGSPNAGYNDVDLRGRIRQWWNRPERRRHANADVQELFRSAQKLFRFRGESCCPSATLLSRETGMRVNEEWDRDLFLDQARAGNLGVLGALLELYRPYLTLLARLEIGRRLRGKADESDVVQDVFVEAVRQFGRFRGTGEPELTAWLRRILAGCLNMLARRYCGTQARDLRLEQTFEHDLDRSSRILDNGLIDRGSSPSHKASRREQAVLLADALERLPVHYREVIVLHSLEGLTFREIGVRMERTPVAIERLWSRALPLLRQALEAVR